MDRRRRNSIGMCVLAAASGVLFISGNVPSIAREWLHEVADSNNSRPVRQKLPSAGLPKQMIAQQQGQSQQQQPPAPPQGSLVTYQPKDYSSLLGMPGFSDKALQQHFKLYQGYVTNVNQLLQTLAQMNASGQQKTQTWSELRRRIGWEWDGMRLHEFYFDNLGGKSPIDPNSRLAKSIVQTWGSMDNWQQDFKDTGAMRGIGWAILYQDPMTGQLVNIWIDEHDSGHLAMATPILVMDVWEHAYMTDYGINRGDYIDAFFKNINWQVAQNRYNEANSTPKQGS
jgi:superoxide dismutase, Fe-Mn family